MSTSSRVTIVMPTYRHGHLIRETLKSLDEQTYQRFELIIVIDGDKDPKYDKEIQGRRWIRLPENVGTGAAINIGFRLAEVNGPLTDYWTWVSSDNIHHPQWLERLVEYLDTHPETDLVYTSYEWSKNGRVLRYAPRPLTDSVDSFIGPSFLYRRELHEKVGPHKANMAHDYDWYLRAEEAGAKISWLDENLCWFRRHRETAVIRQGTDKVRAQAAQYREDALRRRDESRRERDS